MKALLICPSDRSGVARLADHHPLALIPLLGKSLLEYWLEAVVARGAKHVLVLASDRPNQIRAVVGDGARWGVKLELISQNRELMPAEARQKYRPVDAADWLPENDVVLMESLPGLGSHPLFDSYAGWFAAVLAWMPHAAASVRIGAREIAPGVWAGLHSQIDRTAQLHAPCWIGESVVVGPDATIGPDVVIEDRVVVESGTRVAQSVVWPETFVGRLVAVRSSLASGSLLLNWATGSCLQVPDAFLLGPLDAHRFSPTRPSVIGRLMALLAMTITAPIAVVMMGLAVLRGEAPLRVRIGARPRASLRAGGHETFAYSELTGGGNWLRRWPQFWSVVRGDLAWIGNRPLKPAQAFSLSNDFERLWLAAPVGLISLADACGCPEGVSAEACAHASFYAVNANRRLSATILGRALFRAALAWPIYWNRRRDASAPLPQMIPKQEG